MKVGDNVILTHPYTYSPQEKLDWSDVDELPLNSPPIVTHTIETNEGVWVKFDKGECHPSHAFGKFVPYTETKIENKNGKL